MGREEDDRREELLKAVAELDPAYLPLLEAAVSVDIKLVPRLTDLLHRFNEARESVPDEATVQAMAAMCLTSAGDSQRVAAAGATTTTTTTVGDSLSQVPVDAWIQSCMPGAMAGLVTCVACEQSLPKAMFPEKAAQRRPRCEYCLSRGLKAKDGGDEDGEGGNRQGRDRGCGRGGEDVEGEDLLRADVRLDLLDGYGGY